MVTRLEQARLDLAQLEDESAQFVVPHATGMGSVLPHDYGTGIRYGLVVQMDPVKVVWFTGVAETVDHLEPVYEEQRVPDQFTITPTEE